MQYVLSYDVEISAEETYCINFKFFKINTIEPLPKSRGFFIIKSQQLRTSVTQQLKKNEHYKKNNDEPYDDAHVLYHKSSLPKAKDII
ncbi:hypothetical protein GCM10011343_08620 [Flavobacterium orientale]|uniref:Uncharacterized protein n=1 Tax=Flavobacterium orientale TaxID=1756020 RepID=A0A917DB75_9FLAO|nr:hypothetical protein GCM10011343_08620 [Flavobacterium orientale]